MPQCARRCLAEKATGNNRQSLDGVEQAAVGRAGAPNSALAFRVALVQVWRSRSTQSRCPECAASAIGVWRCIFGRFGSAPAPISRPKKSAWPFSAARWQAVFPCCEARTAKSVSAGSKLLVEHIACKIYAASSGARAAAIAWPAKLFQEKLQRLESVSQRRRLANTVRRGACAAVKGWPAKRFRETNKRPACCGDIAVPWYGGLTVASCPAHGYSGLGAAWRLRQLLRQRGSRPVGVIRVQAKS